MPCELNSASGVNELPLLTYLLTYLLLYWCNVLLAVVASFVDNDSAAVCFLLQYCYGLLGSSVGQTTYDTVVSRYSTKYTAGQKKKHLQLLFLR